MHKLLCANFARWRRDYFFWGMATFVIIVSLVFGTTTCNDFIKYSTGDTSYYVEDVLFQFMSYIGFACALCNVLRIGTEFDHHTIRNKLIVGHTRAKVYFSEYITSLVVSEILLIATLLPSGIVGYLFFGSYMFSWSQLLGMILCAVLLTAVFSAITVSISMNVHNRTGALVATMLFLLALLFLAVYCINRLNADPTTFSHVIYTPDGVEYGDLIENPAYVDGIQRTIYEWLTDAMPTGQAVQLTSLKCTRIAHWPLLSIVMLLISTFAGYLPFRKRDIR